MEWDIKGTTVLIDEEDYLRASRHRWSLHTNRSMVYIETTLNKRTVKLHRFILGLVHGDGHIVDHINGSTLDNRRSNLRITTAAGNSRNSKLEKKTCVRYAAYIRWEKRMKYLGLFHTAEEAAEAYDKAAIELCGETAKTNKAIQEAKRIAESDSPKRIRGAS